MSTKTEAPLAGLTKAQMGALVGAYREARGRFDWNITESGWYHAPEPEFSGDMTAFGRLLSELAAREMLVRARVNRQRGTWQTVYYLAERGRRAAEAYLEWRFPA